MDKFARIIVDISLEQLDRAYQYRIPEQLEDKVVPGVNVTIPFGNRKLKGLVIDVVTEPEFDISKTKDIISVDEGKISTEGRLIELAFWMKENFGSTLNQALKVVMPVKQKVTHKEKKKVSLKVSKEDAIALLMEAKRRKHTVKSRILEALIQDEYVEYSLLTDKLNVSGQAVKALENKGVIAVERLEYYRNPVKQITTLGREIEYNEQQLNAIQTFRDNYSRGINDSYLIHGITGSGKTEVYMAMIDEVLKQGRQVIMLIPEISLTYQTVVRFYRKFGDRVSIINSKLSPGERYDQYCRVKKGEVDIMIGPRSALFTPFDRLGLIIIDEEHDGAYKSENAPRYHSVRLAQHICETENASLVLGSATPSIDSYYKAQRGEYKLLKMDKRASNAKLPKVYVEDMRLELQGGNRSIFSKRLKKLIEDRLEKKQQIMLFLNKRGYTSAISCRSCGKVIKCPHCDVSLTYHSMGYSKGRMVCHFCGYEQLMVKNCPECESPYISGFKAGTQQIEQAIGKAFPQARVLRMDADTTSGKDGHEKILAAFMEQEADVLLGTQMIVKGHDFPNVTLVGILAADMSLNASDYTAAEKTFGLLTQAAGRAGRGEIEGEVVIQTYNPEHYSITSSQMHDYEAFYEQELAYRRMGNYPPFTNVLMIKFSCSNEEVLEKAVGLIRPSRKELIVIGPANDSIYKVKDIYNKVMYIKARKYSSLTTLVGELEEYIKKNNIFNRVNVQFDFNPVF